MKLDGLRENEVPEMLNYKYISNNKSNMKY